MSFLEELKRRNVFRVGVAYLVGAWLLIQIADILLDNIGAPAWVLQTLFVVLAVGFFISVFIAWAFELTPEGVKREKDVDRSQSVTPQTGKKLNNTILVLMALAIAYLLFDKFTAQPGSEPFSQQASNQAAPVEEKRALIIPFEATDKSANKATLVIAEQSIAVLPFVNMSSDKEQEYFSDGLSEELLNLLAKIPELKVAARTSSFSFKDQNLEIPEIAARLKVAHILEGSVRKSGNQIRITTQLIQADNGFHLWSETYDRQLDNIFQIQDEIAIAVVDALKITLLGETPRVIETDPEAYQLFLQGQYLSNSSSVETLPQAIRLLKDALEIDPNYAPAWTAVAFAYVSSSGYGLMPIKEAFLLADEAIERSLESDPDYAGAYAARGISNVFNKFNFKAGIDDLQHALLLDPGSAGVISSNGTGARVLGRLDESIQLCDAAIERDPLTPLTHVIRGGALLHMGRLDESEAAYRNALLLSPDFTGLHYRLARVKLGKGDVSAALGEIEQETNEVYGPTGRAMVYHTLSNREASQLALDELIENHAGDAAFQIAEVYAFRNEADKAFEWLEQSIVIRDSGIITTLGNPALLGLRTDPRWQPFLEKLSLLEFWLEMPPEHGGPVQ